MKTFENQCAQGDVLFRRIDADTLPDYGELSQVEPEDGELIVTHSETGHHHVIDSQDAILHVTRVPGIMVMDVKKTTTLRHLREVHTHEEIEFKPGLYEVRRQREATQFGTRFALD